MLEKPFSLITPAVSISKKTIVLSVNNFSPINGAGPVNGAGPA
jgi:hypothetical protein